MASHNIPNPFVEIVERLERIENKLLQITPVKSSSEEDGQIIDTKELCRRLGISKPTVIRYVKRKKIPAIKIGNSVRYNWSKVIKALEK